MTPSRAGWREDVEALRAKAPGHVLFLCVANSARSQIAEGVARSLAPAGVRISSAGSEPTIVRPQALAVLREVGIEAAAQSSKGLGDVVRPVDAVITLCAERGLSGLARGRDEAALAHAGPRGRGRRPRAGA